MPNKKTVKVFIYIFPSADGAMLIVCKLFKTINWFLKFTCTLFYVFDATAQKEKSTNTPGIPHHIDHELVYST